MGADTQVRSGGGNPKGSSVASEVIAGGGRLIDKFGRTITDLRVSITDRCNYKCVYCRDGNGGIQFADLEMEDYLRLIRVFVDLGIEKVRITGGEPLLQRFLPEMIRRLAGLRRRFGQVGEPLDLAVTTNGHFLANLARPLLDAGLTRVTVSMDAVDPEVFARVTRVPGGFERVLAGIREAKRIGLEPVKVNCVLVRGFNDDQIVNFARFSREEGVAVRFIEFMPLGEGRVWTREAVVTLREVVEQLETFRPVVPLPSTNRSETARRYTFDDGLGEIGIIAPVSQPFCGACSRVRLTSDGKIRTCLFSHREHDLFGVLKRGASDEDLACFVRGAIEQKEDRHHIGEPGFRKPSRSMVHIGG